MDVNRKNCVRFIHASDIHLGAQQYRSSYRADDYIRAFQEILLLAILKKVDFILLGGDVFTSLEILPEQLNQVVVILHEFKNHTNAQIPIIAIEGNHDIRNFSKGSRIYRRQSWLKFVSNLGLIILLDADKDIYPDKMYIPYDSETHEGGKIQVKNVVVYGNSYRGENPIEHLTRVCEAIKQDDELFQVLVQHFGIDGQMKDAKGRNIPGIDIKFVQKLRDRVDYLALGHFHKQYILNDWIYNPGSSEAACYQDTYLKRGVFFVEVVQNGKFFKRVYKIRLNNRRVIKHATQFTKPFRNKSHLYDFVIKDIKSSLKLNSNIDPSDWRMPQLYLFLNGIKPLKSCKIDKGELRKLICEEIPVVDLRISEDYSEQINTLKKFM